MKKLYSILLLTVIDFCLIWFYIYQLDLDPSAGMIIVFLVPFVLVLNLLISGFFLYRKRSNYAKLFFINSILASVIMFFLFSARMDKDAYEMAEDWEFKKNDTTFTITRWKKTNEFSVTYSLRPGSSAGYMNGSCEQKDDGWILVSDSLEMRIINEMLVGFRNATDTLKINKIEF